MQQHNYYRTSSLWRRIFFFVVIVGSIWNKKKLFVCLMKKQNKKKTKGVKYTNGFDIKMTYWWNWKNWTKISYTFLLLLNYYTISICIEKLHNFFFALKMFDKTKLFSQNVDDWQLVGQKTDLIEREFFEQKKIEIESL